jgi:hypothetical protein
MKCTTVRSMKTDIFTHIFYWNALIFYTLFTQQFRTAATIFFIKKSNIFVTQKPTNLKCSINDMLGYICSLYTGWSKILIAPDDYSTKKHAWVPRFAAAWWEDWCLCWKVAYSRTHFFFRRLSTPNGTVTILCIPSLRNWKKTKLTRPTFSRIAKRLVQRYVYGTLGRSVCGQNHF